MIKSSITRVQAVKFGYDNHSEMNANDLSVVMSIFKANRSCMACFELFQAAIAPFCTFYNSNIAQLHDVMKCTTYRELVAQNVNAKLFNDILQQGLVTA